MIFTGNLFQVKIWTSYPCYHIYKLHEGRPGNQIDHFLSSYKVRNYNFVSTGTVEFRNRVLLCSPCYYVQARVHLSCCQGDVNIFRIAGERRKKPFGSQNIGALQGIIIRSIAYHSQQLFPLMVNPEIFNHLLF